MANQERKRNLRNDAMMLDILHIIIGILVVICAVLAFLEPEKNQFLFPIIFWLAAFLNGVSGWHRLKNSWRDKKRKISGASLCGVAFVLILLGAASAISIM